MLRIPVATVDPLGRLEERRAVAEDVTAGATGDPERGVSEGFELRRGVVDASARSP